MGSRAFSDWHKVCYDFSVEMNTVRRTSIRGVEFMSAEENWELSAMAQTMPSLLGDGSADLANMDSTKNREADGPLEYGLEGSGFEVDDSGFDLDESIYEFEEEPVPME
jgi:hypothetical protein